MLKNLAYPSRLFRNPISLFKLSFRIFNSKIQFNFVNVPIQSKYYHTPLPTTLDLSLLLCVKEENLDEKMVLLQHVVQLIQKQPRLMTNHTKSIVMKQLKKWQNSPLGRMQKIVTIAWIIKKLNLKKYMQNLYDEIVQRILEDEWYVTMQESIKGLQTFIDLPQELKTQIYEKIERNVSLTTRQVNMKYFKRIFVSLIEAGRYDSMLFDHFQTQILKGLSMQYDAHTIFQIINSYALSKHGSNIFYEVVQEIFYKGHAYNKMHYFIKSESSLEFSGQYLARLVQTYAIVQQNTPIPLDSDFLDYLYKNLMKPKTEYEELSSITRLLKNLKQIQFQEEEIKSIIDSITNTKQIKKFSQLSDLYQFCDEIKSFYGKIPPKVSEQISNILIKQITRKAIPVKWAIESINFLIENDASVNAESQLVDKLVQYIDHQYKYMYPEDQKQVLHALQFASNLPSSISHKLLPGKNG